MRVTTLVENVGCPGCPGAHGLSNYIETEGRTLLLDAGPDGALLEANAAALGVELGRVDMAVLSHGHHDHARGMRRFLALNSRAPLYLHKRALLGHCAAERDGWRDIGVDEALLEEYGERFVLTGDERRIGDGLLLFSDVRTGDLLSASNGSLYERREGARVPDDFRHEQDLLVTEGETAVLFAGCCHRGIVNVLRRCEERLGRAPDAVMAGFHLTNPGLGTDEPEDFVRAVGAELKKRENTRFITGHCTGPGPYAVLKDVLGDRLEYMSVGTVFTF